VFGLGESKIVTLPKDKPQGKLPDEWNSAYVALALSIKDLLISRITASKAGIQEIDVAVAIAEYLAEKDGEEMVSLANKPYNTD